MKFGVTVVVAVNEFATDTDAEIDLVKAKALEAGATAAVRAAHWARGGAGAADLGKAVVEACAVSRAKGTGSFRFLYPLEDAIADKIAAIAKGVYGADGVEFSDVAQTQIQIYTQVAVKV